MVIMKEKTLFKGLFDIKDNVIVYKDREFSFRWERKDAQDAKEFAEYLFKAWGYNDNEE